MVRNIIDITGKTFGRWKVLKKSSAKASQGSFWSCKCSCGTERDVLSYSLRKGISKSCGCTHGNSISKARAVAELIEPVERYTKWGLQYWLVKCHACGVIWESIPSEICSAKYPGICRKCSWSGGAPKRLRPFECAYKVLISSADRKGINNSISYDDFITIISDPFCHYCKASLTWDVSSDKSRSKYLLDRKNNNEGYDLENVVPCCTRCNYMKGNKFTHEEFIVIGKALSELDKRAEVQDAA